MDELFARTRSFLEEDPDPDTRAELGALLQRAEAGEGGARAELRSRFEAPLAFGTAGLRGRVEGGLARMNRLTVMKATWGLGRWLLATQGDRARASGVVVGFDGRHSSRQFAEDAAAVLAGLGVPARLFADPVPTPLVSFATARLGAAGGVMVTASHNPPRDNGYKVYRPDGGQVIPPQDGEIADLMASAPAAREMARLAPPDAAARGLRLRVDDSVEAAYLDGLAGGAWHPPDPTPLRVVFTAMHGVGHRLAIRALERAGFPGVAVVPSQCDPDGAFRTVAFPNPEEKGAMDLALALAAETGAELVLANDPDADRLGAAVRTTAGAGYRMLTGNEIGVLLADDALRHAPSGGRRKLVVTTLVSSTLLSRMARDRGAAYAETLTGFKWIAQAARAGEAAGQAFVFGYEEALGYTAGTLVPDKDGIGAALRLAELARHLKAQGTSLLDRLDGLLVEHGLSHQVQWSLALSGPEGERRREEIMDRLRREPPAEVGGSPVVRARDLRAGGDLPRADVLVLHTAEGGRLIARPSGTEAKVKFYLELLGRASSPGEVASARAALEERSTEEKARLLARLSP